MSTISYTTEQSKNGDYAAAIKELEIPKKSRNNQKLDENQMTIMRGLAGMIQWLAHQCRIDLANGAHQLSRRNPNATIKDLKYANSIVKKVHSRVSSVEEITKFCDLSIKSTIVNIIDVNAIPSNLLVRNASSKTLNDYRFKTHVRNIHIKKIFRMDGKSKER